MEPIPDHELSKVTGGNAADVEAGLAELEKGKELLRDITEGLTIGDSFAASGGGSIAQETG